MTPSNSAQSLEDMIASVRSGLKLAAIRPNNLNYVPHKKQMRFHESGKKGRQYVGGNRSGKTTGGVNEDIWWLTGTHPYLQTPDPPVKGRLTTVDFKNGWNKIIKPVLAQWIPPSFLVNGSWEDSWNGREAILTLSNKSELEIMGYEQELEKFAGVPRHFVHFDEEPPSDIYEECKARLVDYGGHWWMTMTPVEGMTWTYNEIFEPSVAGSNPLIDIIIVDMLENPYLGATEIQEFLEGLDDEAKLIRGRGKYIPIGGLVFRFFDEPKHIIQEGVPPRSWDHYISMDHGFANPAAWLWHAVGPDGTIITYDEHYKSEMTIKQHAEIVKAKELHYMSKHGIIPVTRVADTAITQRSAVTGLSVQIEYAQEGVYLALNRTKDVKVGLNKMNDYFRRDKWYITENCINFRKEILTYKRKQYMTAKIRDRNNLQEDPEKKNDHACDSARYFFSFMPDLKPEKPVQRPSLSREDVAKMMRPGTTFDPRHTTNRMDMGLITSPVLPVIADEYVGEY